MHEHSISVFDSNWWLDAVAPGEWEAVEVAQGAGIVARLPFIRRQRYGMTILSMPGLTQTLGPWLAPSKAKYANQLGQQKEWMSELIDKLPPHDYFVQNFHHSVSNWLPFYWKGFEQTTSYTYLLRDLSSMDSVWSGFRDNVKTDIKKAAKQLVVRSDLDVEKFLDVNELTFARQDKKFPYGRELVRRLDAACSERDARRIFFAEDARGRIHAVAYIIWDERAAYYLMGGADPDLRNSGASSLLLWEAIKFASTVTETFDFEGSMIEPVERFFRAFGATQVPYFRVTRASRRMKILLSSQKLLRSIAGK